MTIRVEKVAGRKFRIAEDQMDLVVTKLLELQVKIFMLRAEEGVKVTFLKLP